LTVDPSNKEIKNNSKEEFDLGGDNEYIQ